MSAENVLSALANANPSTTFQLKIISHSNSVDPKIFKFKHDNSKAFLHPSPYPIIMQFNDISIEIESAEGCPG